MSDSVGYGPWAGAEDLPPLTQAERDLLEKVLGAVWDSGYRCSQASISASTIRNEVIERAIVELVGDDDS